MNAERQMLEFKYQVSAGANTFTVPVYATGHPTAPTIIIPMRKNVPATISVAGNQLIVTVDDDKKVSLATMNDRLVEFMMRSNEISLGLLSKDQKISAFDTLLLEFDRSFAQSTDDRMHINLVRDQIVSDRTAFQKANSDNELASVTSMIRYRNQWMPGANNGPARVSDLVQVQNHTSTFGTN